jgi:hypothetical protein
MHRQCTIRTHGSTLAGLSTYAGVERHRAIWREEGFHIAGKPPYAPQEPFDISQDVVWAHPTIFSKKWRPTRTDSTRRYNWSALFSSSKVLPSAVNFCHELSGSCQVAGQKCNFARHTSRVMRTLGPATASPALVEAFLWPDQATLLFAAMRRKPDAMWIFKGCLSNLAKGITIVRSARSRTELKAAGAPETRAMVQELVQDPLLLNGGRKFHMRLYVVVASYLPLRILLYREGLVNFASTPYQGNKTITAGKKEQGRGGGGGGAGSGSSSVTTPSATARLSYIRDAVLTNSKASVTKQRASSASTWSLTKLRSAIGSAAMDRVWKQIRLAVSQVLCNAAACSERGRRSVPTARQAKCFDLFGLDFLLTRSLTPVLMEVNSAPMIDLPRAQTIATIKGGLMGAIARTVVAPRVNCVRRRESDGARLDKDRARDARHFDELLSIFRAERLSNRRLANASIRSLRRMHAIDVALAREEAFPGKAYPSAGFDECPVDPRNCPKWGRQWAEHELYTTWRAFVLQREPTEGHAQGAAAARTTAAPVKRKGYKEGELKQVKSKHRPARAASHRG